MYKAITSRINQDLRTLLAEQAHRSRDWQAWSRTDATMHRRRCDSDRTRSEEHASQHNGPDFGHGKGHGGGELDVVGA